MGKANPFRFSTKYQDDETDLLYYGRRYYNASTGRLNSTELTRVSSHPNYPKQVPRFSALPDEWF
jgi:RHS repeat-associated protein